MPCKILIVAKMCLFWTTSPPWFDGVRLTCPVTFFFYLNKLNNFSDINSGCLMQINPMTLGTMAHDVLLIKQWPNLSPPPDIWSHLPFEGVRQHPSFFAPIFSVIASRKPRVINLWLPSQTLPLTSTILIHTGLRHISSDCLSPRLSNRCNSFKAAPPSPQLVQLFFMLYS